MALILVADDDELVCEIVRRTLSGRGHIVGSVGNGLDAVRVIATKGPELVILDCSMPGLSGVEALRHIRRSGSRFRTPVLMLTARRSGSDEDIALRAGADDYLRKPFDTADLIVRVEALLNQSERRRLLAS